MNLVELVKGQLGNQVVGQISHLIGEDNAKTESAIHSAIPTLLSDISNKAQSPEGMLGLSSILGKLNDNAIASIPGLLASGKAESLSTQGSSMLANLLGKDQLSSMSESLAASSGISHGASQKLLGVLGPIAIGTLKKNLLASGGISGDNISNLLFGQSAAPEQAFQERSEIATESIATPSHEDIEAVEIAEPFPSYNSEAPAKVLDDAAETLSAQANDFRNSVSDTVKTQADELGKQAEHFLDTRTELGQAVEARADHLQENMQGHVEQAQEQLHGARQKGLETVQDLGAKVQNVADDALDSFSESTDAIKDFASQNLSSAKDAGQATLEAGQEFVETSAQKIGDATASVVEQSKDAAKKASSLGSGLTRFLLPVLIVAIVIFLVLNLFR